MICTFYSYKGGVGRSMALANVGDMLANRGLRVLMIDFDLEAPGLEQFFPISQPRVRSHEGLLDLLLSYKQSMSDTATENSFEQVHDRFILPIYDNLPSGGRLDLMPAGQRETEEQLTRYALNLRTFDWQDFYFNWAGEAFFEWLRTSLLQPTPAAPVPYDVVLVDSRTGVTEMGGVCAYQLADTIVMFCASNHQNVEGTLNMIHDFYSSRVQKLRGNRPLKVVVAPARIERSNDLLLTNLKERFKQVFDEYTPKEFEGEGITFWDLLIPYEPRYAFEEHVASQPRMENAFEKLVTAITLLAEPKMRDKLSQLQIQEDASDEQGPIQPQYDITRTFAGYDVFLSFHHENEAQAASLRERLKDQLGLNVFFDGWDLVQADSWRIRTERALFNSRNCLVLVGKSGLGPWQNDQLVASLEEKSRATGLRVASIALSDGVNLKDQLPRILQEGPVLSFEEVMQEEGLAILRFLVTEENTSPSSTQTVDHGAPYVGLTAFEEKHSKFFYGREAIIDDFIDQIRGGGAISVVGPSGCGKSSLIKAGLFPALRNDSVPGSSSWLLTSLRPDSQPLVSLTTACNRLVAPDSQVQKATADKFQSDDKALDTWLRSFLLAKSDGGYSEPRLVLFVDQFEELFTRCANRQLRESFINNLVYAANSPRTRLTLIVGLRSDFLNPVADYPRMAQWLQSNLFLIPMMSLKELRDAIERPAQKAGLAFEPGLVERILNDVSGAPGALPLLQFLLIELWERRREGFLTTKAYEETGGVTGAVANRANATLKKFSSSEQAVARNIFLRLIQPGTGTEDTRRRGLLSELITESQDADVVHKVVNALVEARLLTTSGEEESEETWVEISHEALVRGWPQLRKWIEDERESLKIRLRLTDDATIWNEAKRDESILYRGARLQELRGWQKEHAAELNKLEREFFVASMKLDLRRKRAARGLQLAGIAAVLILSVLTLFAFRQKTKAETARKEAEETSHQLMLASNQVQKQQNTLELKNKELNDIIGELDNRHKLLNKKNTELSNQKQKLERQAGQLQRALGAEQRLTLYSRLKEAEARKERDAALLAQQQLQSKVAQYETEIQAAATAFSPDGNYLFAPTGNKATLFERNSLQPLATFNLESKISSAIFSADNQSLAVGGTDGEIKIYENPSGSLRAKHFAHTGLVRKITFSSDQKWLASAGDDGTIVILNLSDRTQLSLPRQEGQVIDISFDSSVKTITATLNDGRTSTWDIATGQQLRSVKVGGLTCQPFTLTQAAWTDEEEALRYETAVEKSCGPKEGESYRFVVNAYRKMGAEYLQFAYASYEAQGENENKAIKSLLVSGPSTEQSKMLTDEIASQIKKASSRELTESERKQLNGALQRLLRAEPIKRETTPEPQVECVIDTSLYFDGILQHLPPNGPLGIWRISGIQLNVSSFTELDLNGPLELGRVVTVKGVLRPDCSFDANDLDFRREKESSDDFELKGIIVGPFNNLNRNPNWNVGGVAIKVTQATEIKRGPQAYSSGIKIVVKGKIEKTTGTFIAKSIEPQK